MTQKWKQILVAPELSIRDVLRVIDTEALRIALVTDPDHTLRGVVSDGDIRRGILAGISLESPVSAIMNRNPLTASFNAPHEELARLMQQNSILSVPLIKHGKVVGIKTLHDSLEQPKLSNPVLIMAGGFGTRLGELTRKCPKPMLMVGDKPMLETIMLGFISAGFYNFYISTHYLPDKIRNYFQDGSKWDVNITYVHENTPLGTGGALGLLPDNITQSPLILINGDILTKVNFNKLLDFHCYNNADATMCVRDYEYQVPFGVIDGNGSKITSIVEKPIQRFFINAGIYVLSPSVIKKIDKNVAIDMPTLFEQLIDANKTILKFPIHEYWLDIGQINDFSRAQIDIKAMEHN